MTFGVQGGSNRTQKTKPLPIEENRLQDVCYQLYLILWEGLIHFQPKKLHPHKPMSIAVGCNRHQTGRAARHIKNP